MNILVINQPPFNRGDESAHKGLIRTLLNKMPSVKIFVMSSESVSESVRQYSVIDDRVSYIKTPNHSMKAGVFIRLGMQFGMTWLWFFHPVINLRYRKIYKKADVIICAPGGICMGGFQDWGHLFYLRLAKYFSRPLVYYGRSFGPFPIKTLNNRRFKKVSLQMLNYFSFLSIRDKKTEILAEELGVQYVHTVDSAFLDSPKTSLPYELKSIFKDLEYMVFVPNYLLWHYEYKKKYSHMTIMNFYSKVIDEILSANPELNIVMLPQLFCGKNYSLKDIEFFRDLAEMKKDKRIIVISDCYSSDIQQAIISRAKYVIGARYHSIVFSLNQGVPCIALSYEHKIAGLLESLGKSDWCIDFTASLDSQESQQQCLDNIRNIIPNLEPCPNVQKNAKDIANKCMDTFIEYLNNTFVS